MTPHLLLGIDTGGTYTDAVLFSEATGPADPRQKLVYVIEPTTTGAAERIIVTTRTAAAKRGDQLPEPFVAP